MDLRKRRSQEKLQSALAYHLETKTIDQVTIGELTKTAGVSRQTFYSNFHSKQSILLNKIELILARSRNNFESLAKRSDLGREEMVELGMRHLLLECSKESHMMRAAFTGQAGIQCLSLAKEMLRGLITDRILFQFHHNFSDHQMDIISEFYAGAIIGTVQGWLLNEGPDRDLNSVARQVGRLIPHGLDGYLKTA